MKSIFEYMEYREYLRDFFEEKKKEHSFYSYRLFSQKAGFRSPNFLKLIVDGKRNLTKESVYKITKAVGLNKSEAEYFENLVFFNQSKTIEEKNFYLSKIFRYRIKSNPKILDQSEYEYYSRWYNPVICELITAIDFKEDYHKLAAAVIPSITPSEAERSVQLLMKLGLIEKNSEGRYVRKYSTISTGPQVRSIAVANYHREMMKLASESIERFKAAERDITGVTISVSDETYNLIKEKLRLLRKELLEISENEKKTDRVVQLNMQLFPLSIRLQKGDNK